MNYLECARARRVRAHQIKKMEFKNGPVAPKEYL